MTAPRISFEFFPPQTLDASFKLWETVQMLQPLSPEFVSVTYGAGGTTRQLTHEAVTALASHYGLNVAAHLTCVDATRDEIAEIADAYWRAGVRHIVALRGDPPGGASRFEPHPQGYANAVELVAGLRQLHPFELSVSAYPEVHPDAASPAAALDNLKRKLDAGASRAITQFFFEPDTFFRFQDACLAAGIDAEIVPGIMPVTNFAAIQRMSAMTGTAVPDWLGHLFEGLDEKPAARQLVAATVAAEFCRRLYAGGVRNFHFYTLNRAELSYAICHLLGLRPETEA